MRRKFDVISFNPRRQHNFEQAYQLQKHFPNFKHVTSLYFSGSLVSYAKKISSKLGALLQKRSYPGLKKKYVGAHPIQELIRLYKRFRKSRIDYFYFNDLFSQIIVENYEPPKICIGYDTASLPVFKAWKNKATLVLDLCIGLPQYRLVVDRGEHFTMSDLNGQSETYKKIFQRYNEELELADIILCGSEFVKETAVFFGHPEQKLKVLNYGVDVREFDNKNKRYNRNTAGLKFVFVGALSWRKGADVLIDAWKEFIVKHPGNSLHFYGSVDPEIDIVNVPQAIFHGHVDRATLVHELKNSDVFVFPSTFEGSALSVFQAMALKLSIITTKNSGTVVVHNQDGLLTKVGNRRELVQNMELLLKDPDLRIKFAESAYNKVQKYSWDNYGLQLKELLNSLL